MTLALNRNKTRRAQREGRFLERGQKQTTEGNHDENGSCVSPRGSQFALSAKHDLQRPISTTQQRHGADSFFDPGHTMIGLLDMGRRDPDMIRAMTTEPNVFKPANLTERTYPPNEGIDKSYTYATVPRIMNHHIVLDNLPHPARSSITALRTFLDAGSVRDRPAKPWPEILLTHFSFPLKR